MSNKHAFYTLAYHQNDIIRHIYSILSLTPHFVNVITKYYMYFLLKIHNYYLNKKLYYRNTDKTKIYPSKNIFLTKFRILNTIRNEFFRLKCIKLYVIIIQ